MRSTPFPSSDYPCAMPEPVTFGHLAGYPTFCIVVTKGDDPSAPAWIDLWGVEPCGDVDADYAAGWFHGDEAVQHAQEHGGSDFVEAVLMFMAHRLHHEQRPASRLEWGFVDRVVMNYPGIVERLVARIYRTHGRLN
jgi:hypothetical protein